MTDAFLIGGLAVLGLVVLVAEAALSLLNETRIFRVALGTALAGGVAGLALEPRMMHLAFLGGVAIAGSLGGAVCAFLMVIDGIARGGRSRDE
jgi:hypothetical protein